MLWYLFQNLSLFLPVDINVILIPAPTMKGSGECGVLYMAEPRDACTELTNKVERLSNASSPFVLIIRGGCSFEEKVRRAQSAGFKAAIVYDDEADGVLVASNDQFLLFSMVLFHSLPKFSVAIIC